MMTSMNLLIFTFVSTVLVNQECRSSVVIDRYDGDDCAAELDPKLKQEIASYAFITKQIMDTINNSKGRDMYEQYNNFIDKFGARLAGSENLENAIDHMINLTKVQGLHDITTEEVDVPHWVRGHESMLMTSPHQKNISILGTGPSVRTPWEGITAEAIVVRSFDELDSTDDSSINGKIVVYNAPFTTYSETVIYMVQGATRAAKKGAVASLVRSITPFSLYTPHTGYQRYKENVKKIPAASITLEDADLLQRLQENGEKIILTLKMLSTFDIKKSRNTIIDLKGTESPEKVVIVSGHIDSWDVGQGAIDDGGGMMISWFVPVILNSLKLRPRRTIRAILWTAEEEGLVGAIAYLKRHVHELPNINFVMESDAGTFNPLGLKVAGSKKARCIIAEILKLFTPINKFKKSDSPGSDIVEFINEGVPGASLLNENNRYFWYYHSQADTMDVQNMTNVINCAAFWTAVSYVIADLPEDIPRY